MKKLLFLNVILFFSIDCVIAQDRLKTNGQIPILEWYSIPANETTVARYQELKEAGITHSLSFFLLMQMIYKKH